MNRLPPRLKEFNFLDYLRTLPKRLTASLQDGWINFKASSLAHKIYVGLLLVTLISLLWMSQSTPISGDEFRYYEYCRRVYNYFATGGEDKLALEDIGIDPVHYNPFGFSVVMYYIEQWFGVDDYMEMRHFFIALVGFLAILFTSLIAYKTAGEKAAILAVLFLILTPRFIGHSLNNDRDIPPVASYAFTLFILLRYYKEYPKLKLKTLFLLFMGLYSAYFIRLAGGLLLSTFVGLYMLSYHVYKQKFKQLFSIVSLKQIRITILSVIGISFLALAGSILLWPFAVEKPIENILLVIKSSSDYPVYLKQLFEGKLILSLYLPRYFTVKFMLISIPLFTFLGMLLYLGSSIKDRFKQFTFEQYTYLFSFIFPLFYVTFFVNVEYGGWRHFLIVYPFMVLLAVHGFLYFMKSRQKIVKYSVKGILAILLFLPLKFSAMNHPYHYLYFNEFVGGLKKAYKEYESDYGCHGLYGGAEWFKQNILPDLKKKNKKVKIATNSDTHLKYYFRKNTANVEVIYTRYYEKLEKKWNYAIFYLGFISPTQLKNHYWPPDGTIHTVEVDGAPIGVVQKSLSDEAYKGFLASKRKNFKQAITHYRNYLKVNPRSEEAYIELAKQYLFLKKFKEATFYSDKALIFHPRHGNALLVKGIVFYNQKKYPEALNIFNQVISIVPTNQFTAAYFYKALTLYAQKKPKQAIEILNTANNINPKQINCLILTADIYFDYQNYKGAETFYKKILALDKNNAYANIRLLHCYYFQKKFKEFVRQEDKVINYNGFEIFGLYCIIYLETGKMKDAKQMFDRIKHIDDNSFVALSKATYYRKTNQLEKAKSECRKAIKLNINNTKAYALLGELKALTNNKARN